MKLKDNKIFRWIIIPVCIFLCFFGKYLPHGNALSDDAMGVLYTFLGSLILWLTIGIDWPSLLCILSLGLIQSIGFTNEFKNSFGNETVMFLLFTFVCTYALSKTNFIRRVAIGFVNSKLAKKSGYWFVFLFLFATLILGLFISPTVLFVILLPILEEIFKITKIEKGDKVGKVLMMGLGFTVSISSGMTTIAHAFPVTAIGALNNTGYSVSSLQYMAAALPTGLVLFILMYLMFRYIIKPDVSKLYNADVSSLKKDLPKMDKKEIISLAVFILVILMWIVPEFFPKDSLIYTLFKGNKLTSLKGLGTAMPPLLGSIALCIIRVDNEPLIKVEEAFKKGIPWTSILMCAATLSLASALTNDAIGIKGFINNTMSNSLTNVSPIILLIIFTGWAGIQTNVSSNLVTAQLVSTVAVTLLLPLNPMPLNICVVVSLVGFLASCAFSTPPSMPHIAIVAGSEYANSKDVLLYGGILTILSIGLSMLIGYPLGSLVM